MTTADELSRLLEPNASVGSIKVPSGWLDLVADCHRRLIKVHPDYQLFQVKEKFGGLRYYTGPVPSVVSESFFGVIKRAEDKSFQTCQSCGKVGHLLSIGKWYYTLCQEHEDATREWKRKQWEQ